MGSVVKNPIGTLGRGLLAGATGGLSEFAQKNPFSAPINNPLNKYLPVNNDYLKTGSLFGKDNPYVSGPFSLDPAQDAADQSAIEGLGNKQYGDAQAFITGDASARSAARQSLADALTKQSQASFQQSLPETEEMLNSQHLLNGSGLGQELARQQGNIATNIANQVGTLGANDIDMASQQKAAALAALQGNQSSGLQRHFSLEDFINQANVSKTLGQSFTPQMNNGKAQTGALLQGVGGLAPLAKLGKAAAV